MCVLLSASYYTNQMNTCKGVEGKPIIMKLSIAIIDVAKYSKLIFFEQSGKMQGMH